MRGGHRSGRALARDSATVGARPGPVAALVVLGVAVLAFLAAFIGRSDRADAQVMPSPTLIAGCFGDDHPPFTRAVPVGFRGNSMFIYAGSFRDVPQDTTAELSVSGPSGVLTGSGSVDGTGRAEIIIGIFSFGTYQVQGPLVLNYRLPNGTSGSSQITSLTGMTFTVGPNDVMCTSAGLPPGQLFVAPSPVSPSVLPPSVDRPRDDGPEVVTTDDDDGGLPYEALVGVGVPMMLVGAGSLVANRGRQRLQDAGHDDINFMQAFLEGFSLSGRGTETATMDRAFERATQQEEIVQRQVAREYEYLVERASTAFAHYTEALDRFQTAYVRSLSGSTELQGLLTQYAEASDIAQKQDLAFAIVTLVRGLGTLAVRTTRWIRAPATVTSATRTAGASARTAMPLAGGGAQLPGWLVTANRMRTNAKNLQRIPGVHDVFVHGWTPGFIRQNAAGQWLTMSARRVARVIRRTSGWKPGMPIRLFSCYSARAGSAGALARELKTWVYAPSKKIWIDSAGRVLHDPGGVTVLFDPNGIARFVIRNGQKIPLAVP